MRDLISVIIPVYNVEKYLDRCIKSVVNQTYKNLEIIIVDDGSTDNSGIICDKYASIDSRIKVYHKKNGGLSSARNFGITKSKGKYLAFLDSDDFIHYKMYEKLLKYLIETNSQMAISKVLRFKNEKELKKINLEKSNLEVLSGMDKFKYLEEKKVDTVLASNKLYDRHLFDDIKYPDGKIHEDAFIIHHLLDKSTRVVYTNEILFYYFIRNDGITGIYNLKRLDEIESIKDRVNFFSSNKFKNTNYLEETFLVYCGYLIIHYFSLNYYNKNKIYSKEIKKIKKEYNLNYPYIMKCHITLKNKLKYILVRYFGFIYLVLKYMEVKLKKNEN